MGQLLGYFHHHCNHFVSSISTKKANLCKTNKKTTMTILFSFLLWTLNCEKSQNSGFSWLDQRSTPSNLVGVSDAHNIVLFTVCMWWLIIINYPTVLHHWNTDCITPTSWTSRDTHRVGSHTNTFCINVFKAITATENVSC